MEWRQVRIREINGSRSLLFERSENDVPAAGIETPGFLHNGAAAFPR